MNPLLEITDLPQFSKIEVVHVERALDVVLSDNRLEIENILSSTDNYDWDNFMSPMTALENRLARVWSPVEHMMGVVSSSGLRDAYNKCLSKLSKYETDLGQDARLYAAFEMVGMDSTLSGEQKKAISNKLRDFQLSGIGLDLKTQRRYMEIDQRLAELGSKFADNVLSATQAWRKLVTCDSLLTGMPPSSIAFAKQNAAENKLDGWLLTLDAPCYSAVMMYADSGDLREEIYKAHTTRASDQGPNSGEFDNAPIMDEILSLRHELAEILGFNNYAELSLDQKMAKSTQSVMSFLNDLRARSSTQARDDYANIVAYASNVGNGDIQPWDISYYSEKLQQQKFNVTEEEIKKYFPENRVIRGLFDIVNKLYGITITERYDFDTWHNDVRFFDIRDSGGNDRGGFYLDLYARKNKCGGAWMDECVSRIKTGTSLQLPVAYLTCNFAPPVDGEVPHLTHTEITTLFHEFGHGLHHMLTKVDTMHVSGIAGVSWDAVELPSQFLENWCWNREAVELISKNLPDDMFDKLLNAKNFNAGMAMARSVELSMFDFKIHMEYTSASGNHIKETLDGVRKEVSVISYPEYHRFQNSFSHIFAGGYAAGYYSYSWAEVLSADAFSKFEEMGIFNKETGSHFMKTILENGGSRDAMDLFVEFRGREPDMSAMLRHKGIIG